MLAVHNAPVIAVEQRIGSVHFRGAASQQGDELVMHVAFHQHVVGRDARLPAIEELPERDAPCGEREIGVRSDDAGAFSSQLERDGGQVLRRLAHDELADGAASFDCRHV